MPRLSTHTHIRQRTLNHFPGQLHGLACWFVIWAAGHLHAPMGALRAESIPGANQPSRFKGVASTTLISPAAKVAETFDSPGTTV